MIRFSVTNLDAYRRFLTDENMTVEDLVAYLRKETPPTRAMLAGSAFHKVLEHAESDLDAAEQDGFRFLFDLDATIALPQVRELKGEMAFQTPVGPVTLVGVVDGMTGKTVRDYKLTSQFDAERYIDSLQWKAYLLMFGATRFDYEVFIGKDEGDYWRVYDYQRLPLSIYPRIEDDVTSAVRDFAEFWARHMYIKEAA